MTLPAEMKWLLKTFTVQGERIMRKTAGPLRPDARKRLRITVTGRVQGVGFRPGVFCMASSRGLSGRVFNFSGGAEIDVEGASRAVEGFLDDLKASPPRGSLIRSINAASLPPEGFKGFRIEGSLVASPASAEVSPDRALCRECARELGSPSDRRHMYPFINCSSCGPRFTIVRDIPYDRENTSMSCFTMCRNCRGEYEDPFDRRFHAQPAACPSCGPEVEFISADEPRLKGAAALLRACSLLAAGKIGAVKSLGGFHLACDAKNAESAVMLRRRKRRGRKPFALMAADTEVVRKYCRVSRREEELLMSPRSPVVLLDRKNGASLPDSIAFFSRSLGFMLPYTPLHSVLFKMLPPGSVLVMTSGNSADEPIVSGDSEAEKELKEICDFLLTHNRGIIAPCDDSVSRIAPGMDSEYPVRRSRGYVPEPVFLDSGKAAPAVFAAGGDLKSTFCLGAGGRYILSQHGGDLSNLKTYNFYVENIQRFKELFRVEPEVFACDMHPGYNSAVYAGLHSPREPVRIQHHHAHIASCMADNGLPPWEEVIGVAFDGTGYGPDGSLWGGEFLAAGYGSFKRVAFLSPVKLPGGEKAVLEPWRLGVSLLYEAFGADFRDYLTSGLRKFGGGAIESVIRMLESGINCPLSSSAGRLFDGVSAILGLCGSISYEGEAAAALEAEAADSPGEYSFRLAGSSPAAVDYLPLIRQVAEDAVRGVPAAVISEKFHRTVALIVAEACVLAKERTGIERAALSGGVFQNMNLLRKTIQLLKERGVGVLIHGKVPPNDGGLSLGQAVAASYIAVNGG